MLRRIFNAVLLSAFTTGRFVFAQDALTQAQTIESARSSQLLQDLTVVGTNHHPHRIDIIELCSEIDAQARRQRET